MKESKVKKLIIDLIIELASEISVKVEKSELRDKLISERDIIKFKLKKYI